MAEKQMIVSSSPHIRNQRTTQSIMRDVLIALLPALVASIVLFGFRALLMVLTTVTSCVISEAVSRKVMKRDNTITDLSAAVSGVLLAFCLPVTLPLWIAAIGGVVAIVVVKQMFGGLGQNFVNPALVARIVLMVSFPVQMTNFIAPMATGADALSAATPLAIGAVKGALPSMMDLLLGLRAGSLGETCIIALLIGAGYLFIRKVILPVIPVVFIGTTALCYIMMGMDPLFWIMTGGIVLGAFFMATDYVTSPITIKGQVIFAIGIGLLTFVIRQFASLPEGVSYAIVLMNLFVPHIDRMTKPKYFGEQQHV